MTHALLLVPPFLKYISGPLLGPAMLQAAGTQAGHEVQVLDLNALWIREHLEETPEVAGPFVGDHDQPHALMKSVEDRFLAQLSEHAQLERRGALGLAPGKAMTLSHQEVIAAASHLVGSPSGAWLRARLADTPRPEVLGLSLLYSGQVLWALAAAKIARELWPELIILWGGPHVTALKQHIASCAAPGTWADGFVFGYAEQTFTALLDAVEQRRPWPAEVTPAGADQPGPDALGDGNLRPAFSRLDLYGLPRLNLPAQLSRGCAYGKCAFCTYPKIEGRYTTLEEACTRAVMEEAQRRGAVISFKDSLMLVARLRRVAALVQGRVKWSACTKLHPSMDAALLHELAQGGCATLELGLETLTPQGQLMIDKKQPIALLQQVMDHAEQAKISLIINYITGLPGVAPTTEGEHLELLQQELRRRPGLRARVEHNTFELERLSPMGQQPAKYGLCVSRSWPWSSLLEYVSQDTQPSPRHHRRTPLRGRPVPPRG